jgi:hypothetical protein
VNTMTTHKTTIVGKCPKGCDDLYDATFTVFGRVIEVELIDEAIRQATEKPIYQEALGTYLAERLGCTVALVGRHGRFLTESVSNPP